MTLSNIITFDLLSSYDGKLKNWIKNLKASLTQDGLLSKEDYQKIQDIESNAQVNVLEGVSVNGTNLTPDANKRVNIEVPTDFYTQSEVDAKDTAILENVLGRIWSNKKADGSGNFQTKFENANGSYAQIWNESDGGGTQYFNKDTNVLSFVGVNNGAGNNIYAQIYAKDKTTNTGVRINVTPTGAYYNVKNGIDVSPEYEIATKGDIVAVQGEIPTTLSAFTNDMTFLTSAEIDAKIATATTAAVVYKGSVPTYDELPTDAGIGHMYNVIDSDYNYIWNGTEWDPSAMLKIETATEAQIASLFD